MRSLSLGRTLRIGLVGLTLLLAAIAGIGVADLYQARQRYEDRLARAYELEATAANLLAAGVIEDAALRTRTGTAASRARAQEAFAQAAAAAQRLSRGDAPSRRLLAALLAAEARGRTLATGPHRSRAEAESALREARSLSGRLAARQGVRRDAAREQAATDSRHALLAIGIGGGLALIAALALVGGLVAALRRPLDALVRSTGRLAGGDLSGRVAPSGPRELRDLAESFNAMASGLEAARTDLERERARLATTVASLGDALLVADGSGRVVARNPRAEELLPELTEGTAPEEVLGAAEAALAAPRALERDGRTLEVTAARLAEEQGLVWTVRDVSERARLERLKTEFVATASHELRSPLTSIKGFAELLGRSQELGPAEREWVGIIETSTNRLVELVGDLLDSTRLEAGRLELRPEAVALPELVEEAVTLLRPRVEEKRQELIVEAPPADALPAAWADPARVRQILLNLLTNAHAYTGEGGRIVVRLTAEPAALRLEVADSGPGLSPDQIAHVFDRFYRVEGSDRPAGSGLGLSIVRSLVDLHGGSVEAHSAPGEGATFTVRLPPAAVAGAHGSVGSAAG